MLHPWLTQINPRTIHSCVKEMTPSLNQQLQLVRHLEKHRPRQQTASTQNPRQPSTAMSPGWGPGLAPITKFSTRPEANPASPSTDRPEAPASHSQPRPHLLGPCCHYWGLPRPSQFTFQVPKPIGSPEICSSKELGVVVNGAPSLLLAPTVAVGRGLGQLCLC